MRGMIKVLILIVAILTFVFGTIYTMTADPIPQPVGVAGRVLVNDLPIEDGITVTVTNLNTMEKDVTETMNGYYVATLSANNGDVIKVNITYKGMNVENTTVVNISRITQWCNISINYTQNTPPRIKIKSVFYGEEGKNIIFDASECYDPDGYIISYNWIFYTVPPFSLSGKQVEKLFDDETKIWGLLTVTDNRGATNSSIFQVIVNNTNPVVRLQYKEYTAKCGEEVIFIANATDSGKDTLYYRWDFDGDGEWDTAYSTSNRSSYVYTLAGNYTVTVEVSDGDGGIAEDSSKVVIYEGNVNIKPVAIINVYGNLSINEDIILDASASYDPDGNITDYVWEVDGEKYYSKNVTVKFEKGGNKTIKLTVTDDMGESNTTTKILNIKEPDSENGYTLRIVSDKYVTLEILRENEVVYNASGYYFTTSLLPGQYRIVYTYNGKIYEKEITIDGEKDIKLDFGRKSIPAFEILFIIVGILIVLGGKNVKKN